MAPLSALDAVQVETDLWVKLAEAGHIVVPCMEQGYSDAIINALKLGMVSATPLTFWIDVKEGDTASWYIADLIAAYPHPVRTIVDEDAHSAGLWLAMVGAERLATPGASFIAHGEWNHFKRDKENKWRSELLAKWSKMSAAWWIGLFDASETTEFGVEEAQEWGIIDAVIEKEDLVKYWMNGTGVALP